MQTVIVIQNLSHFLLGFHGNFPWKAEMSVDFAIPRPAYHPFYWATEWPLPLPLMPPSLLCYKRPPLGVLGAFWDEPCDHDRP